MQEDFPRTRSPSQSMKRTHIYIRFLIVLLSVFCYGPPLTSAEDAGIDTEQLIQSRQFTTAIKHLTQALQKNPADAKAALQLGSCYLHTGYYGEAYSALAAAVQGNAEYVETVATLYFNAAAKAMGENEIRFSRVLFQKAIELQPDIRKAAATEAFRQGEHLFFAGKPHEADARFSVANSLDESYGQRICNIYFNRGNASEGTACVDYYRVAAWYCPSHNEEIGLRLLRMAKAHSAEEVSEMLRSEAARYVSGETIESVFPSPSWKTIESRSYIGKGLSEGNDPQYHLPTVRFGQTAARGDKLVVETDGKFKIWDAGWEEHESRCELIVRNPIAGDYFYVQAKKDRRIVVTVQRYQ